MTRADLGKRGWRPWQASLLIGVGALGIACGEDDDPFTPAAPTVSGYVHGDASGWLPVGGAVVRLGELVDTTSADGEYRFTGLEPGPATLSIGARGYADFEVAITIPASGPVNRDVILTWLELFEAGDFTAYVPDAWSTRAILVALGGPDTRGFAAGTPFGAPVAEVEASLQALGEALRGLATEEGFAILGTSRAAMANGPESDALILEAIEEIAETTGLPELADAPLLLYGISGGAPEGSGFVTRNPERVAGLFLKVPAGVEPHSGGEDLGLPAYIVLAEMDAFIDNESIGTTYRAHRNAGAPWALALEPDVPHHSLSPRQRALTVNWMAAIVDLRVGSSAADPLHNVIESSGWLGDPVTLEAVPFAEYEGDPRDASWFPTQATAEEWEVFVRGGS